jgi:hypothetical protein
MTKRFRAATVAVCGVLACSLAGAAVAAVVPRLTVTTTRPSNVVNVDARVGQADDTVARVQLSMPSGFTLSSPPGGTQVGTAEVTSVYTQLGPQQVTKMAGTVTAIATNDPAITWENANCDAVTHLGAWMVKVQGADNAWSFPIFVDATTGTETQFGATKLVACFKPLEMEPHGNKLVIMTLALNRFTSPSTSGTFRWRGLFTPFAANGTTLNAAGSAETFATWSTVAQTTTTSRTSTTGGPSSGGSPIGLKKSGTAGNDRLTGTARNDELNGRRGNDVIRGLGGHDLLIGGLGRDTLSGGGGQDTLQARDGRRDVVDCGPGRDIANADRVDAVAKNCEVVKRG